METPIEIRITLTKQDIARARLFVYFRSGFGVAITAAGILFSVVNLFLAALFRTALGPRARMRS